MFPRSPARLILLAALALGLAVRVVILWHTTNLGTTIVDEQQYTRIATNILAGNGFGWAAGDLTSIRPPLYPGLLAAVWSVTGFADLQAIRIVQIVLALATGGLIYLLGTRLYSRTVGCWAAAFVWLYPGFIFFNFLILTETLFTFLLVAFVLLAVMLVQSPRTGIALACGLALGLAVLTRSVLWPFPLLVCPLLAAFIRAPLSRRLALPAVVLVGYVVVVAPWAVRNTKLQGVFTVVDTMGGINLRMGNYEFTPDDRMWDAVALQGAQGWMHGYTPNYPGEPVTEGRKDKWAQRQAVQYMREHPGTTLRRSAIKFADLFGLEREFIAGIRSRLFAPPEWFGIAGSVAIVLAYVLLVTAGAAGIWIAPPGDRRLHVLVLLPMAVIVAAHTIVFGHSRYHLPLMPLLAVYGAALLTNHLRALRLSPRTMVLGATVTVAVLAAIWVRQIAFVDLPRIAELLNHVG